MIHVRLLSSKSAPGSLQHSSRSYKYNPLTLVFSPSTAGLKNVDIQRKIGQSFGKRFVKLVRIHENGEGRDAGGIY